MNNNQTLSPRFLSIDLAKNIAIVGVVIIHSLDKQNFQFSQEIVSYFRFAVPIFIIYSFFLLDIKSVNQEKSDLYKRLFRIFIPYIFYSIIYYILLGKYQHKLNIIDTIRFYFTGFGWPGQYYLILLFQLTIIYTFFSKKLNLNLFKVMLICVCSFLLFNIPFLYFNIIPFIGEMKFTPFIYSIPYLIWGIYLSRTYSNIYQVENRKDIVLNLIILALIPTIIFLEKDSLNSSKIYGSLSCIICALIVTYIFLSLEKIINKLPKKAITIINKISRNSLGIYCLNPGIINLIKFIFSRYVILNISAEIQSLIIFVLAFSICFVLCEIIAQWKSISSLVR